MKAQSSAKGWLKRLQVRIYSHALGVMCEKIRTYMNRAEIM